MHDKSTRVRGCIEHKSKGCAEDFPEVINVFRMSHASTAFLARTDKHVSVRDKRSLSRVGG
jgi:hypothetical protein